MPLRIKISVRGAVQGVGFRYYTYRIAKRLSLGGYVRNMPDGSVEIVAEGERPKLMHLIEELRIGPPSSTVDDLGVKWEDPKNEYSEFKILR